MQQQIIRETFLLVSKRDENVCNFLEGGRSVAPPFAICSFIGLLNLGGRYRYSILMRKGRVCKSDQLLISGRLQW